ncbi:hypothetical protein BJX64DRAFT_54422 [Aspergillus heterothallicus]
MVGGDMSSKGFAARTQAAGDQWANMVRISKSPEIIVEPEDDASHERDNFAFSRDICFSLDFNDNLGSPKDFIACSLECGYYSHCDY